MKNVLFAALVSAVATTTSWAQSPQTSAEPVQLWAQVLTAQARPAPATAPPAAPAPPPQAAPPAPPPPATVAAVPARSGVTAPRNVRFDIVITEAGTAKPSTKTISITVSDSNGNGSVRNLVKAPGDSTVSLNVDVRAVQAFDGGAVRAAINVEYQPYTPDASAPSSGIQSSITSMFQDGRKTQILQTADPLSDRRTTIDVTMTVLK